MGLSRFLKKINGESLYSALSCFEFIGHKIVDNTVRLHFANSSPVTIKHISEIIKQVNNLNLLHKEKLTLTFRVQEDNYIEQLVNLLKTANISEFNKIIDHSQFEISEDTVIIRVISDMEKKIIEKYLNSTEQYYSYVGYSKRIKVINDEKKKQVIENKIDNEKKSKIENLHLEKSKVALPSNQTTNLKNVQANNTYWLEGLVFKVERNKTKNNSEVIKIFITDNTDSILVKSFLTGKKVINVNEGDYIKLRSKIVIDPYEKNNLVGSIEEIHIKQKEENTSLTESERIEFLVRTNMSAYDGITSVDECLSFCKSNGIKAIGFADFNSVQSFPQIQKLSKKYGITPIYGCEFDVIESKIKCISGESDIKIDEATYIVFDLETTGLYANIDRIIEFGACKIRSGSVVDKINFFIDPEMSIPQHITNITKIRDEDVKGCGTFKENYLKILNFIGEKDAILVAHNGINFDINFLNAELRRCNLKEVENTLIDTMMISRANNDFAYHRLGFLAKKYKIEYDEDTAHRADYDAQVLAKIWLEMIEQLKWSKVYTISQIRNLCETTQLAKNRSYGSKTIVYARNRKGISAMYKFLSKAHTESLHESPKLEWSNILDDRANIIITNNPYEGKLFETALNKSDNEIEKEIEKYDFISVASIGNISNEISRKNFTEKDVQSIVKKIIAMSKKLGKMVVAVSDSYYLSTEHKIYREIYINTKSLRGRLHRLYSKSSSQYPDCHLRNEKQAIESFSFLDEQLTKEIVIDNPKKILEMIEKDIKPIPSGLFAPKIEGVDEKLKSVVYGRLNTLYGNNANELIIERVDKELNSIIKNGFSVVYWISHLLVINSLKDGYLVGSRGSVGSSFVAFLMEITEVNPLRSHYLCHNCKHFEINTKSDSGFDLENVLCPNCSSKMFGDGHDIPFETFLGFDGDKVPDIDLNFSGEYQSTAHNFIRNMFGEKHTFRAGTIATVAQKTAYGFVKNYLEIVNRQETREAEVERLSMKVQGVKRTTGQHPGGIIVVPKEYDVFDFFPYNYPADDKTSDWKTTHFEFESIHDNLLKLDILGHDDPTALKLLHEWTGFNPKNVPMNDKDVISLFNGSEKLNFVTKEISSDKIGTLAIPEFGTDFVRNMLKETKPKSFADLIRISGLSHGTDVWTGNARNMIIENKLDLKSLICCRDDIMIYLIKNKVKPILAFKIMEDVRKGKGLKEEYIIEMRKNGIDEWYIDSCNKIKYMFPKSHAAAYVLMAWRIAWYKVNYPCAFYSSYFSTRLDVFDIETISSGVESIKSKINEINKRLSDSVEKKNVKEKEKNLLPVYEVALELYARGYKVDRINLLKSDSRKYMPDELNKTIIPPFSSLDGLGQSVAESIVKAREQKPFTSKEDFVERTSTSKTILESLSKHGLFDNLVEKDGGLKLW
jgi:DNA polymerase-3 subunit alpha (Gram-positive type)